MKIQYEDGPDILRIENVGVIHKGVPVEVSEEIGRSLIGKKHLGFREITETRFRTSRNDKTDKIKKED